MSPIQIILIGIIAVIIVKILQKYKSSAISIREFFLWVAFWLIVAVLVIFPNATQTVANWVGITRGVDLIVYLSVIVLYFSLFYILVRLERLERDITKIVRKMALKEENDKSNRQNNQETITKCPRPPCFATRSGQANNNQFSNNQ
ncbi:MAG: hypothetical protein A2445_04825 [Candidatus Jacksonbacteria bacterium RIFOXYC2_FULL_44_29]|nr:MAG: hypothetical protein UW45_C0002G0013 [Parcubacteria group bacterium GW2011_GWC2_44_22]OGY75184.1 MAG: hypothetical protein A2240_01110 [Candidatus Jacksonbacteria bacterium RIFOXYA2_FULL_43_12]OGY75646.1 MAG: hypothetical protein A2295_04705 [Candidatus Jacksonbacteria bacterium RIFOXYB2_FULL_44_15]OGY77790.1 MAG: hypothetical protein A2445_04825 [Candidatus Jacksonbacteria bacterium RIFOXYC2_FULL_44_29]OGY79520.1 MAG: hypothetical protein A2550_02115 [Candidatus Jacksonbacteria bacteri